MSYVFKWKVNGDESAVQTINFKDSEKDPVKKWYTIDI